MVLLFSGMQSSLSMVYDRDGGDENSPHRTLPRWYMLLAKLISGTLLSIVQAYCFLIICIPIVNIYTPFLTNYTGWILAFPFIVLFGLMLGSLGLLLSVYITIRKLGDYELCNISNVFYFFSSFTYGVWSIMVLLLFIT